MSSAEIATVVARWVAKGVCVSGLILVVAFHWRLCALAWRHRSRKS